MKTGPASRGCGAGSSMPKEEYCADLEKLLLELGKTVRHDISYQ
jgi:hypothetical protein